MPKAGNDGQPPSLLCVANFPANTGYAWDFFEGLYAAAADHLNSRGIRTLVAFPSVSAVPERLARSAAETVVRPLELESPASLRRFARFLRRERVRVLYLTDRPAWHPAYPFLRLAGVRRIVVYDQTSGERTRPTGLKRWLKMLSRRIPGMTADRVLAVSDYVAERHRDIGMIPPARIETVRNSIPLPPASDGNERARLAEALGLPTDRPVVACTARAATYKGVHFLLEAFDRVWTERANGGSGELPILVYVGDGPELDNLRRLRDRLAAKEDIHLAGYRTDAAEISGSADLAVVPSVWQEAFGLAVLEPMGHGRPVIASAVGGIPEIVEHEATGLLVPPGDVAALAEAIGWMLENPDEARRMGQRGRERTRLHFSPEAQMSSLVSALTQGFPQGASPPHDP